MLSMKNAQSLHSLIAKIITMNHQEINFSKSVVAEFYAKSIVGTPEGEAAFEVLNMVRTDVRALREENKRLAETAKQLKMHLKNLK